MLCPFPAMRARPLALCCWQLPPPNGRTVRRVCRSVLAVALTGLSLLWSATVRGEELSGPQILEKSREAMEAPIKYKVVTNGIAVDILDAFLSDGTRTTRTTVSEPMRRVSIARGDQVVDVYPDLGISLDSTFMLNSIRGQANNLRNDIDQTASSREITRRDDVMWAGRACYSVETRTPPNILQLVAASLPNDARAGLPHATIQIIAKDDYTLVAVKSLSEDGTVLSTSQYMEVARDIKFSDASFLPPDGFDLKVPTSSQEYFAMLAAASPHAPAPPRPVRPTFTAPPRPMIAIDSESQRPIFPRLPGMSNEDFDRVNKWTSRDNKLHLEPYSAPRRTVLWVTVLAVVVLGVLVLFRHLPLKRGSHEN